MKFQIVFATLFCMAWCKPLEDYVISVRQDTLGNYRFEYNIGNIARTEERTEDGTVRGGFRYVDGEGMVQEIEYTAGVNGFQVSGTNLPVSVVDTAEVAAAKTAHFALFDDIKSTLPVEDISLQETPSVAEKHNFA